MDEFKIPQKQPDFLIAPLEVIQDHRLTLMQTRILLALLSFRNKQTNTIYPRREILAQRAGYSIGVISRTTTQLSSLGWLKKKGDGGKRKASIYEVIVPDFHAVTVTEPVTVTESVTVTEPDTQTVTESVRGGVTESVRGNTEQTIGTDKGTDNIKKIQKKINCEDLILIFNFWKSVMNHPRARIDKVRNKTIQAAFNMGYEIIDLKDAIMGCSMSEWHMGKNDRSTRYDGLHIIFKTADQIDKFIGIHNQGGAKAGRLAEIDNISNQAIDEWLKESNVININEVSRG